MRFGSGLRDLCLTVLADLVGIMEEIRAEHEHERDRGMLRREEAVPGAIRAGDPPGSRAAVVKSTPGEGRTAA